MTHEEWLGQIMQAVHAANAGNNQELHRLASLLEAQEEIPSVREIVAYEDREPIGPAGIQGTQETPEPYNAPRGFAEPLAVEQTTEGDKLA